MGKYKDDYIVLNFPHETSSINKSGVYFEIMFPKIFKISLDRSIVDSYVDKLISEYRSENYTLMDNTIREMIEYQEQKMWIKRFSFYLVIQYYPSDTDSNILNFYKRLDTRSFVESNFIPWILSKTDFLQLNNPRILFAENVLKAIDFNYIKERTLENILNKSYIIKEEKGYVRGQMQIYLFMKLYEYYKEK